MNPNVPLVIASALLAAMTSGCLGGGESLAPSNGSFDPSAPFDDGAATDPSLVSYPLLVELNGTALRHSAAEITIPQGEYRLLRIVFTSDVWGQEHPWGEDSGRIDFAAAWNMDGNGTIMVSDGAQGKPVRPELIFASVPGSSDYIGRRVYDGKESPPTDEAALLLGSPDAATVLRLGILTPGPAPESPTIFYPLGEPPSALWNRSAIQVRADAATPAAFAGTAVRSQVGQEQVHYANGVMMAEWNDGALPTGTQQGRTSSYEATAFAAERGVLSTSFGGQDTAGVENWSYSLAAPGMNAAEGGPWVHTSSPLPSAVLDLGLVVPPTVRVQGVVNPGPVHFQADRSFSGQQDPIGSNTISIEGATIGYAGIDLETLFGWDLSRPPESSSPANVHHRLPLEVRQGR